MKLLLGQSLCPCSFGSLLAPESGAVHETYVTGDKMHHTAGLMVGNAMNHLIHTYLFLGVMTNDCLGVNTRTGR
jgi:hypothetical protein